MTRRLWAGLGAWILPAVALAAEPEEAAQATPALDALWGWWGLAAAGSAVALLFALKFFRQVKREAEGSDVREGARAYLRRQYRVVAIVFAAICVVLAFLAFGLKVQSAWVPFAFLTGGVLSGLCGYLGMKGSASARSVMGLLVVGFGLIDICAWFLILYKAVPWVYAQTGWAFFQPMSLVEITVTMLCFGVGASTQALFARVGGVAGMGADLYESYCASILSTTALGVAAASTLAAGDEGLQLRFILCPMAIAGIGNLLSVLGCFLVRSGEQATQRQLLKALARGVNASTWGIAIVSGVVVHFMLPPEHFGIWGAILVGLIAGRAIGKWTEHSAGPTAITVASMAQGMLSTWFPVLVVAAGIVASYALAGGFVHTALGLYGIGIAAVGMLSTLGVTLAPHACGPIADNAGANTTAATSRGFAIAAAALTALALIAAYLEEIRAGMGYMARDAAAVYATEQGGAGHACDHVYYIKEAGKDRVQTFVDIGRDPDLAAKPTQEAIEAAVASHKLTPVGQVTPDQFMSFYDGGLLNPKVLAGMMIGAMLAFVFCGLAMKCVESSTAGGQCGMVLPALLAFIVPVAVGLVLGVSGVVGLLAAALATGFALAVKMANAGGTSLNTLIKLMPMVAIVFAGVTVKVAPTIAKWLGM